MKKLRESSSVRAHFAVEKPTSFNLLKLTRVSALCLCLGIAQPSIALLPVSSNSVVNTQTQKKVSGVVKDLNGISLPGVSIMIKGTTMGGVTDMDGNFSLPNIEANSTLVVSFIGMVTKEIVVNGGEVLNIVLEEETVGIDEVVAIGYVTRKKGEVTGSVSTVSSEKLEKSGNKDLAKSLSGKVPGLIVADRGGYPGSTGDMTLLIRGKSTLNDNSPLILIDGITASSFSHLAPQDIKSLTVLKDGAAAIYGAKAANGVILITTKRGKSGKPHISLSSSYNLSSFSSTPTLMNSAQYATYNNEIAERYGTKLPYTDEQISKYAAGNDPINYPSTNWFDETFAKYSPESRTSLSISGGSDYVNYFVSGDYLDQTGMYESGDLTFKQYQIRSNIDVNLYENFKIGVDLSGRFGENNEPGINASYIYKHIYTNEPTEIGIYPNGLPGWGGENGANPIVMSSNESGFVKKTSNDLRGKFSFDWKMDWLLKGLSAKGFAGIRRQNSDTKDWYTPWEVYSYQEGNDKYVAQTGYNQEGDKRILKESFWKFDELMLNATVHYLKVLNNSHTIRGFVGYEQATSTERSFWASRKDFPSKDHPELFAGGDEGQQSYGTSAEWARVNYFGSFSYDYKKKYFVDLTFRRDGSSAFGENNRFGNFPGAAVSWSIADESFLDFADDWLNVLKVRSSWALMGNDRVNSFQYLTRFNYGGATNVSQPNYYIFGTTGTRYNGYDSSATANPDITWEKADMKNIGVSFGLLNNRLTGDVNYFYQKREDILIERNASIPDVSGLTLPKENLGKVNNYGWEFEMGWNDKVGKLEYNIGANLTQAKNEVVYMDEAADVPNWRKQEGHSMDSYIVYPTAGIFRDQEAVDAASAKLEGTVEGEPNYLDTDGNGKIEANDRVRSYTSNVPEIQFGIYGGVSYKGFDLSFLLQGQTKAKMLVFFDQQGAKPDYVFTERWTAENKDARYPRAFGLNDAYSSSQNTADNFEGADFYLHDASFLRLKELELAYTFPKSICKEVDLKVFARGFNLLTMFSDVYDMGLDPEASGYNNFRESTYPSVKTYTVGFNLNF